MVAPTLTAVVDTASALGVTPQTVMAATGWDIGRAQQTVQAITGLDAGAQTAILQGAEDVVQGGFAPESFTPLLGAAIAIVNPIAGAAVAVGLPLVEGIIKSLAGGGAQADWYIGKVGWQLPPGSGRPYGPGDPNNHWWSFDDFWAAKPVWQKLLPFESNVWEAIIPGLSAIGAEGGDPVPATPQDVFLQVYKGAWRKNAELLFNGHTWLDPYKLAETVALYWNQTHAPGAGFTFTGQGTTYLDYLIKGDYRGLGNPPYSIDDHPTLTINTGAALAPPPRIVHVTPLTFQNNGPTDVAVSSQNVNVQKGAWTAVYGPSLQFSAEGFATLKAKGITRGFYNTLSEAGKSLVLEAAIPVINPPSSTLGDSAKAPLLSAAAPSTGPSVAMVGTVGVIGLAAILAFKFL